MVEKIMEMTAKTGFLICQLINSDLSPEDVRSMCCRLRLNNKELLKRGGGLFGANPLTGSIGVVTLNMPRIGYLAKSKEDFLGRVRYLMDLAKESLLLKRRVLENLMDTGLYPYSRHYLASVKERFGDSGIITLILSVWWGCTRLCSTTAQGYRYPEGQAIATRSLITCGIFWWSIKKRRINCLIWRLHQKVQPIGCRTTRKYPILLPRADEPYYTNSTQLPVGFTDDISMPWICGRAADQVCR